MIPSGQQLQNFQQPNQQTFQDNFQNKRKKDYICPCGRPYGSYPALYAHIKRKHDGKAPGQITKPKSIRRRGRPFKYDPSQLQSENPHRNAAKHLENYFIERHPERDYNQYPLKQFADRNSKDPYQNFKYSQDDLLKHQYGYKMAYSGSQNSGNNMEGSVQRFWQREGKSILPQVGSLGQTWQEQQAGMEQEPHNQQKPIKESFEQRGQNYRYADHEYAGSTKENLQNYKRLAKQKSSLQHTDFIHNETFYNRPQFLQAQNSRYYPEREFDPLIENQFLRPFQIAFQKQMQNKFEHISDGIEYFLQPILQQLLNQSSLVQEQKPISLDESPIQKPVAQQQHPASQNVQQATQILHNQHNKPSSSPKKPEKVNPQKQNLRQNQTQILPQTITVSTLLQNQHFRDILKWLMSPPEQIPSQRIKENYIEFSFRCCLVEFLDFVHKFLETAQYEQVLLAFVFFCDHILAKTMSFQLRPEPKVYEMGLYLNSLINEYLPKLSKLMPCLENFYIFKGTKRRISELFMWLSSWQAVQQYYHNKYHREKIIYEISKQNQKCMVYQTKYQIYMREALRGSDGGPEQIINFDPSVQQQPYPINHNILIEEKVQENPEIQFVNPQQRHHINEENEEPHISQNLQEGSPSISKNQQLQVPRQNLIGSSSFVRDQIQINSSSRLNISGDQPESGDDEQPNNSGGQASDSDGESNSQSIQEQ